MKQTAVDWLFEKMDVFRFSDISTSVTASKQVWEEIYKQAKQMEKEQIKEAYDAGYNSGCSYMYDGKKQFKNKNQYYNKTYENEP